MCSRWGRAGVWCALTASLALAATGCSADEPSARAGTDRRNVATVIQPGRPGEAARTLSPDATLPGSRWNAADVGFVRRMIPHHAQALRMCALARSRASHPQVAAVARRIDAAQSPEILALSAWLDDRGLHLPSAHGPSTAPDTLHGSGHHHGSQHGSRQDGGGMLMPGMLSAAEMRALAQASGARFDRLFLAGMVRHHRGAVRMAERVGTRGTDLRVSEIAAEVATEQQAEINHMGDLRRRL
jgi:uncharacterized protein (DUF305 family)